MLILAFVAITVHLFAAGEFKRKSLDSTVLMRFQIHYPINGTEIKEDFMGNARLLPMIQEYFEKSPRIDSITIFSSASPDGPLANNRRLARERGMNAKKYLLAHMPAERHLPDSIIKIDDTAENWEDLYKMIQDEYPYADKADVLELLDAETITDDRRKVLLKRLNGGKPWQYIKREILPHLRYATWVAVWVKIQRESDLPQRPEPDYFTTVYTAPYLPVIDTLPTYVWPEIEDTCIVEYKQTRTLFALKSNLLYDALSLVNYSVELPLYRNKLSMVLYHQFPWWRWGEAKNEYCLRFLSVGGEARWWFLPKVHEATDRRIRRDKFTGHFLGVYSESGKYDFERQRDICYQGEFWSAGLSYGYAMPIGKRLNMEFSISAGYASIAYRGYTSSEDYEILWRDHDKVGRWHYFGPTKAQVSLVIPITAKLK